MQRAPTIDAAEVARFSALAEEWWNPRGKMAVLHKFNPVRLGYIRDAACKRFARDPKQLDCLKDLRDVRHAHKVVSSGRPVSLCVHHSGCSFNPCQP